MRSDRSSMLLVPLACLALGACEGPVTIQHRVEIRNPPQYVAASATSALRVPASCPVYAPGGGDIDTPEPPFPAGVAIMCVVDDTGGTYGIVTGDAPTARLAVIPGNRELGLYVGFSEPGNGVLSAYDDLSGDSADIKMWAARSHVSRPTQDFTGARLELRAVAQGPQGVLVSLGRFDGVPAEVRGSVAAGTWYVGFYVNAPL